MANLGGLDLAPAPAAAVSLKSFPYHLHVVYTQGAEATKVHNIASNLE